MNELAETLVDGLLEGEASSGATFTWAGRTYPCNGGAAFGGRRLDLGGMKLLSDATVVARTAVFPGGNRPTAKQTLTYIAAPGAAPRPLRIKDVDLIFDDVLVIECDDPNQGA